MRIMHYIFGMPPLRGGGTIKYAMDLAEGQAKAGHDVALIYPGEIQQGHRRVKVIKNRRRGQVKVYEIINPLPVPLVTGIRETSFFMAESEKEVYDEFLEKMKPDVLHVHSLMGLHREFLAAAKEKGVELVFTTHDYFGICPKTNLLYHGKICNDCQWEHCEECCVGAEDIKTLARRQSHWFQFLIRFKQLVKVKHLLWGSVKQKENRAETEEQRQYIYEHNQADSYDSLKKYYIAELDMMDIVHYNSSVVREQYEKRIKPKKTVVLGGMHKDICDRRKKRSYGTVIRFSYLGYAVDYKGYYLLLDVFDGLSRKYGSQFVLNTYMGDAGERRNYIRQHEPYTYEQLEQVYDEMDLLIVPSMCAETYGLVTLEALSYGVPVIVTRNVGASDLLIQNDGMGYIVEPSYETLYDALEKILKDKKILRQLNETICNAKIEFNYENYVKKIIEMYQQ